MATDLEVLRTALRAEADAVALSLLGAPNRALSSARGWRWGRKGSLALRLDGERRGLWADHSTGEGGDLLGLIQRETASDFKSALAWARRWVGMEDRPVPPLRAEPSPATPAHATLSPWGRRVWESALPITAGTAAARYLAGRGCALPGSHAVRWVPALPYGPGDTSFPCVLGLVTDAISGVMVNLHRTWLAHDGAGKAPVPVPRLLLKGHRKRGSVVRLTADEDVTAGMGIGEGLETCLTVLAAGWKPIWSGIDAGNLGAFPILPGIEALTVLADRDPAGLRGAGKCAQRWRDAGREARIVIPPTAGDDLNDWAARL